MEESRKQFEYEAGKALNLPTSIIESARKGDGYDHAFDSMNIMQPLNEWWHWWKKSRAVIELDLPKKYYSEAYLGNGCCDDYANDKLDKVYSVVRAAGLKIKAP